MQNQKYKFYRLGQEARKANKLNEAIEYYKQYSTHLEEKDKHIPMLWIHDILITQENYLEAKSFLLKFCEGCSFPYAAKILRDRAVIYKNNGFEDIYKFLVKESKSYQKKQLELTKN